MLLALAGLVLLAAGCGSGGASPGVASLGSSTTTTNASVAAAGGSGAANYADAVAYAQCIRSHGVPTFPDPDSQGNFRFGPQQHLPARGSPTFVSADKSCQHLLPNNGQPTAAQLAQDLARALRYARCMRAHGIAKFADPVERGGGVTLSLGGTGLKPNSPVMVRAQQACRGLAP
ncbi:MAG: hypothetical protein JWM85_2170 [Acidimicrobiaceae bacterium]|nr:hypothetical protein [Acidimicrobiaceae bacterium]